MYLLDTAERDDAESIIKAVAPEELAYFNLLLKRPSPFDRLRGRAIGYGVENAVEVISPYVILAVVWARGVVLDEIKSVSEERLRKLVRQVRLPKAKQVKPPTPESVEDWRVNPTVLSNAIEDYATRLGAPIEQAKLLADAVTGRLMRERRE